MSEQSRRILIFSTAYLPFIGGAELALKEITDRIKDVKFDLITLKFKNDLPGQEAIGNINIYRLNSGKVIFPIKAFLKALTLKLNYRYDTIFALQASYGAGAAWLYKLFQSKVRFILNLQEGKNLEKQNFLINLLRKMIIKRADAIVAISNYLANYAKQINKKAQIIVIPNGVDLQKFKFKNNQLKITDKNEKIIITVSRLVTKNGIGDLIEAFHILHTKYKILNTKLKIIGDGPLEESLNLKIKNLKLEDRVSIIGEVSHDQVPEYLSRADLFVRPSLSEGLGTAFLEAMACGVPVIATLQGGIVDFLEDKKTGIFCRPGDSQNIADKINLLLNDQNLRENIITNAIKVVEERYDWNKITDQYIVLFNSLNT